MEFANAGGSPRSASRSSPRRRGSRTWLLDAAANLADPVSLVGRIRISAVEVVHGVEALVMEADDDPFLVEDRAAGASRLGRGAVVEAASVGGHQLVVHEGDGQRSAVRMPDQVDAGNGRLLVLLPRRTAVGDREGLDLRLFLGEA